LTIVVIVIRLYKGFNFVVVASLAVAQLNMATARLATTAILF
jgi:hypothetical protein